MQTASIHPIPSPMPIAIDPNEYVLSGKHVQIGYSATSITGAPLLRYRDATHDVHARGDEIRRQETELGTLVTVTLEPDADAGSLLLTVVIPRTLLRSTSDKVQITTRAVLTRNRLPSGSRGDSTPDLPGHPAPGHGPPGLFLTPGASALLTRRVSSMTRTASWVPLT